MADFLGIAAIIFFYILILIVGIWAGRKTKDSKELDGEGQSLLLCNVGSMLPPINTIRVAPETGVKMCTQAGVHNREDCFDVEMPRARNKV